MFVRTLNTITHHPTVNSKLTNLKTVFGFYYTCKQLPKHCNSSQNHNRYSTGIEPASMATDGLPLSVVVKTLNKFASTSLAESWDNVGLLIEPVVPRSITHILLTNDLTDAVMAEAVDLSIDLIISYHPPIFAPLKSITNRTWKERIVATCLENKIALYSPHTSFDAVKGGVNDWLASAFDTVWVKPLIQSYLPGCLRVDVTLPASVVGQKMYNLQSRFKHLITANNSGGDTSSGTNAIRVIELLTGGTELQILCSKSQLSQVSDIFYSSSLGPESSFKIVKHEETPHADHGMGRICQLKKATPVDDIIEVLKDHLGLPHLRLALAVGKDRSSEVSTIALCAGSGASVLKSAKADLFLTGEMLHHDILDAVHNGSHVLLTNHSDSERGFLASFAETLASNLLDGKVEVSLSREDRDPLTTV